MREILFRGKRVDNGEWVYGFLTEDINRGFFIIPKDELPIPQIACQRKTSNVYGWIDYLGIGVIEVIPETVGQYTGLTDKNGVKIFEGDVVLMPSYMGGKHKAIIYFKNGKFAVDGSNYYFKDICPKNMQVIGNIHDNPELLNDNQKLNL